MGTADKSFNSNVKKMQAKKGIKGLIRALKDKDSSVQWEAMDALGEIKDERAVGPIIKILKDEDNYVREKSANALGKIGDRRAVEPLIEALKDENGHVRSSVQRMLLGR